MSIDKLFFWNEECRLFSLEETDNDRSKSDKDVKTKPLPRFQG